MIENFLSKIVEEKETAAAALNVFADWLEEKGYTEAARAFRAAFCP